MAAKAGDADPKADFQVDVGVDDAVLTRKTRCRVSQIAARAMAIVAGVRAWHPGRYVRLEDVRRSRRRRIRGRRGASAPQRTGEERR